LNLEPTDYESAALTS